VAKPSRFEDFAGPGGRPTEAERRLIEVSAKGSVSNCLGLADEEKVIGSALVAALATGRFAHPDWPDWSLHDNGITLHDARVLERLDLANRRIPASLGFIGCSFAVGIDLDGARIDGYLILRNCIVDGECRLVSAVIARQFIASGARFRNAGSRAVVAQSIKAAGWIMDKAEVEGQLDINGAEIAGQFHATDAKFRNAEAIAISAQAVKTSSWFLNRSELYGIFVINNADIFGAFEANNVLFKNPDGVAIVGHSARFHGGLYMRSKTMVHGDINLAAATIDKAFDLSGSTLMAGRYRALRLQDTRITGDTTFRGAVVFGHVHSNRARFEGRVSFQDATIVAATLARERGNLPEALGSANAAVAAADEERQHRLRHHALVFQEARIEGRLVLPESCPEGIVDLSRARCDTLEDFADGWPPPITRGTAACDGRVCVGETDVQQLVLDGFEYAHLANPSGVPGAAGDAGRIAAARIAWLAGQAAGALKRHFHPQPWRQAALTLRAMGHDEAAQKIAIERRVRQRMADETGRFQRAVSWLLHQVADYGFNPWRTVAISAGVIVLFWVLYAGGDALCGRPGACAGQPAYVEVQYGNLRPGAAAAGGYPAFSPALYSLDAFVPLLDLGGERYWQANTQARLPLRSPVLAYADGTPILGAAVPVGWLLHILFVLERIVGAILIAIAVTGFTGILTRDDR